jgi:hypothetical protein
MPGTYEKIATTTLGSAQATVTFSSIPSTYTDLVLITNEKQTNTSNRSSALRLNSDSGSNYSQTGLYGTGSAAASFRTTNTSLIYYGYQGYSNTANFYLVTIVNINNYSNTTTNKTVLSRSSNSLTGVDAILGLWRNTAAITSITLTMETLSNFDTGCTFTLYGIKAA